MKLAALVALLALGAQDKPTPIDYCAKLAPLKPIAGLAGFQSTSTIVYDAAPDRPHVLETTYVFPDRARWYLTLRDADASVRHLEYRCGEVYFEIGESSRESTLVTRGRTDANAWDDPWLDKCAATELRRALFLWPDGFDWREGKGVRTAQTAYGFKLEADSLQDGRPSLMQAIGSTGDSANDSVLASYNRIEWQELRGRWWPKSMELSHGSSAVWTETVDSVETSVHFLDEFFVPPDRRLAASGAVRADSPAALTRRVALPANTDWPTARERASKLATDELAKLVAAGWQSDAGTWFELGDDGRPSACLLRLRPSSRPAPEGFELVAETTAMCATVAGVDGDLAAAIASLRAALPAGTTSARPMLRMTASGERTQVILPLRPR
jgi:hypothetical protein